MKWTARVFATCIFLTVYSPGNLFGQFRETQLAPNGDWDPTSFSLFGDFIIVGNAKEYPQPDSAYIFHFDGENWVEQAKLGASDGRSGDGFGNMVSLSGDHAIVGARYDDTQGGPGAGSAYIFHYNGSAWVEQVKLTSTNPFPQGSFGTTVAISGDFAFVGQAADDTTYIFHYDGTRWLEHSRIHPNGEVSFSGDYALMGGDEFAKIFHYDGANWVEEAILTASDGSTSDNFGYNISLSGDYAIVGAPRYDHDEKSTNTGSAYVFHFDGTDWVEQAKLEPRDGEDNSYFGSSVSLSGEYALIGCEWDDDNGIQSGSAYIFHYDGANWVQQVKLTASDGTNADEFGFQVSMSSKVALVGATRGGSGGNGSVYVYSAAPLCSKVSQFQARCRPGGVIKARVIMADASHAGDVIEISIDDVPYEVTIDASGRGQLSQGGFSSGPHTVELTNPGQCFDPIVVTCRTGLDEEASDDWDDELISESPKETTLLGNYPNPFNPSTTIRYMLSNDGSVSIRVYNMLGQEVATLIDGFQKAGERSVVWHGVNSFGQSVASGLYVYRLQAGSTVMSQKMLFAK